MQNLLVPLFSALYVVGAYIKIPIPPVAITLQSLFWFIASLTLDWKRCLFSSLLWLFLGLVGLPVFTSGGGIAAMTGPSAGYIYGFVIGSVVVCLIKKGKETKTWQNVVLCLFEEVFIYAVGLIWLGTTRNMSIGATLSAGLLPFIPGDAIKIAVASLVSTPILTEINKRSRMEKNEDND